jgi:hypothetical protein
MHRFRSASALVLAAALFVPVAVQAAAPRSTQTRVYDRTHKDYHVWDNSEDQAYRGYLTDQHAKYKPITKQSHTRQDAYWNYRHTSSDHR